jgi:thioredoxin-like negative regulator of GroEL
MQTVTQEVAIEAINTHNLVAVYWGVKNCPSCEQFNETLVEVAEAAPEWSILKVSLDEVIDLLGRDTAYFEPDVYPTVFFFKGSERVFVATGIGTVKAVLNTLNDIASENYKSAAELEQEMLDALD